MVIDEQEKAMLEAIGVRLIKLRTEGFPYESCFLRVKSLQYKFQQFKTPLPIIRSNFVGFDFLTEKELLLTFDAGHFYFNIKTHKLEI